MAHNDTLTANPAPSMTDFDHMPQPLWLKTVDSTNRYAVRNFDDLADGTLVLAHRQTAGRGRRGKTWLSPAGVNIYASFVMKKLAASPMQATIVASLATLDTLRQTAPETGFWLKWPNDIFHGHRKIAGILCEAITGDGNRVRGLVAGIGVNLNMSRDALDTIDQPAASLADITGNKIDLKNFANLLAFAMYQSYITHSSSFPELLVRWKQENLILGKEVAILTEREAVSGKVVDFDASGALLLSVAGEIRKFFSGDVRIARESLDFPI